GGRPGTRAGTWRTGSLLAGCSSSGARKTGAAAPGCLNGSSSCAAAMRPGSCWSPLRPEYPSRYSPTTSGCSPSWAQTRELRLRGRADADSDDAAALLADATGVFFSGGDQSRLRTLVGSRTNEMLRARLREGLVIGGTSAGATAMGTDMILGGDGPDVSAGAVRTGPGLGLVPKVLIDMHFGERGRLPRLLSAVALDPDQRGVGIDENTAILVDGGAFEVLGTGVVTVADAEPATVVHAAGDCEPITLFGVRLHLMPAGCLFDIDARAPAIGPAHDRY